MGCNDQNALDVKIGVNRPVMRSKLFTLKTEKTEKMGRGGVGYNSVYEKNVWLQLS